MRVEVFDRFKTIEYSNASIEHDSVPCMQVLQYISPYLCGCQAEKLHLVPCDTAQASNAVSLYGEGKSGQPRLGKELRMWFQIQHGVPLKSA